MGKVSKAFSKIESGQKSQQTESPAFVTTQKKDEPVEKLRKSEDLNHNFLPPSPINPTKDWDERLVYAIEKFSGIAESIRKIRTMILHPDGESKIKTIAVISSDPQEGKSFVCGNLGVSLAQSLERQALMIDCDLRRPALQGLFGLKSKNGLTDYLRGKNEISELILQTGLPKLSIIPAGLAPGNPSELLTSNKMSAMITELTNRYDDRLLILDTAPFHAASETLVLSQLVDKVVVVVRWGKSGREKIKKVIDTIGRDKILGVVFNAFEMNILDRKVQGVGYHNYYSEAYY